MCGICGQFNFGTGEPVEEHLIRRMTRTVAHRGPDDQGHHLDGYLGLGFRRLSIIDLEGGHQPMSDQEKSVWVVFNGEIYNFRELRIRLESLGHTFRTHSDTEVIIHGYKQWGTEVFSRLNGMFGVAIWDVRKRRLILARDAMGIKLVYYRIEKGQLWFGSEIRPILVALKERPEIDPVSLNLFLRYRFTPSPYTIYQGVRKLAAGTMLVVEEGNYQLQRWYNYKPEPFPETKSDEEATEELLELYKAAVRRHLISDVPVGLLLSGGIDSGLLLGLMNRERGAWPTFSVGYGSSFRDDELEDAAETAAIFDARHAAVRLDHKTFRKNLPKIVDCLEEPIAASSIVPMYFVSQRAREDVKVALIGQGPDELFGGYKRHLGVHYGWLWAVLPLWVRRPVAAGVNALPRNETLKRGVHSLAVEERLKRYQQVLSLAPADQIDSLFRDDILPPNPGDRILECWDDLAPQMDGLDDLGAFQLLELRSTLPDELLMYGDKLSMAHSLEVRVPYLDREVVEYVQRLNASFKIRNGTRKWLHRQVCRNFLPGQILNRKKRGFAVNVVDDWFRQSVNGSMANRITSSEARLSVHLKSSALDQLVKSHEASQKDNHKLLFSMVVLEEFLNRSSLLES